MLLIMLVKATAIKSRCSTIGTYTLRSFIMIDRILRNGINDHSAYLVD